MRRACVIGYPISHSLSPHLHGHWLKTYGIDGDYSALEIKPEKLREGLEQLQAKGYQGCNLTLPHKELALEIMDELSDSARAIGAVNTVLMREDGHLYGTNTDAYGFMENLKSHCLNQDVTPYLKHCFILGAGGAAKAVYYALKQAGAETISITNRNRARAENFDAQVIDWERKEQLLSDVSLLVNTTSLGMKGQSELALSLDTLPKSALVSDIVYQPLMTDLLMQAKRRGHLVVTGIGMLIYQAVPGFEMWFGQKPNVTGEIFTLLESKLV